jgi:probable F420-dependent oxidoreductase
MKVGVLYWATDETMPPAEFARALEERGFESFWLGDHTHVPVSRVTEYPSSAKRNPGIDSVGLEPGEIPPDYKRLLPPFIALSMAAMTTRHIKLGTSICLVAQRDPILLAKETATLDNLSGGRFLFGVGFGWSVEEMSNHGVDPQHRHQLVREKVAAIKALWTQDEAEFSGKYVQLPPTWMWPKPLQRPHPPIHIGAAPPLGIRHAVEYGDGWMPLAGKVVEKMAMLRTAAEEAGRDPATLEVTVTSPRPSLEGLEHYRKAGVTRVILWAPPPCRYDDALPLLDEWSRLVPELDGD